MPCSFRPARAAIPGQRRGVRICGPDALDQVVREYDVHGQGEILDPRRFLASDAYRPLPTLVAAARELLHQGNATANKTGGGRDRQCSRSRFRNRARGGANPYTASCVVDRRPWRGQDVGRAASCAFALHRRSCDSTRGREADRTGRFPVGQWSVGRGAAVRVSRRRWGRAHVCPRRQGLREASQHRGETRAVGTCAGLRRGAAGLRRGDGRLQTS